MKFCALRSAVTAVLVSASVGGCGHISAATLYKLWTFDMATADPAAIRAAIRFPKALAPRPGGAKLTITETGAGGSGASTRVFVLEEVEEAGALDRYRRDGYPVKAFRLSAVSVEELRRLQADVRAARAASRNKPGSLGVSIDACRLGPLPPGALLSSTYLKLDAREPYMPVVEDIDLRKEIGENALATQVPPCATQ